MKHQLTTAELATARARVAKINARADKQGMGGRWALIATPTTWTETNESGTSYTAHGFDVEVSGEMPKLEGGWKFAGTAKTVDGHLIVATAPGAPVIRHSDITPGACDHCGTKRPRNKTILVVNDAGEMMQVGGQCVKDFLGHAVPWFVSVEDLNAEIDRMASGRAAAWATVDVVRAAMSVVAGEGGYRPAAMPGSTRDVVVDYLAGKGTKAHEAARALVDANPVSVEEAEAAIAEGLAGFAGADEGYRANMFAALSAGFVEASTMGLVVSLPVALAKLRGEAAKRAAAPVRVSAFIGSMGDKVTVEGVIVRMMGVETMYGWTRLVVVDTAEGTVKMFTTAKWTDDFSEGDRVSIVGTVKAHDEYEGHRQTMLARPKGVAA